MVIKGLWLWSLLLLTGGPQVGVPGEEGGETDRDALPPLVTECVLPTRSKMEMDSGGGVWWGGGCSRKTTDALHGNYN